MTVEGVKAYFRDNGLEYRILEFDESIETVELAAQALGVRPELIAKTLAFKVKDRGVLVMTKGDARIDNRKFKDQFQVKEIPFWTQMNAQRRRSRGASACAACAPRAQIFWIKNIKIINICVYLPALVRHELSIILSL